MRQIVLVALVGAALAGCGSSGSSTPPAPTVTATVTPTTAPSIHAQPFAALSFFLACEQTKIVLAELSHPNPRAALVLTDLTKAASGFRQAALPALQSYAGALSAAVGQLPAAQMAAARQTVAMCRASGQTTGTS